MFDSQLLLKGLSFGYLFAIVSDVDNTVWRMAAISFILAAMMGVLVQYDKSLSTSDTFNKATCFCGSMFSGIAGFVVFAHYRDTIPDPLQMLTAVIFAGIFGAPLVKVAAEQFKKRFLGGDK